MDEKYIWKWTYKLADEISRYAQEKTHLWKLQPIDNFLVVPEQETAILIEYRTHVDTGYSWKLYCEKA